MQYFARERAVKLPYAKLNASQFLDIGRFRDERKTKPLRLAIWQGENAGIDASRLRACQASPDANVLQAAKAAPPAGVNFFMTSKDAIEGGDAFLNVRRDIRASEIERGD
jgi:hypothetical protein